MVQISTTALNVRPKYPVTSSSPASDVAAFFPRPPVRCVFFKGGILLRNERALFQELGYIYYSGRFAGLPGAAGGGPVPILIVRLIIPDIFFLIFSRK